MMKDSHDKLEKANSKSERKKTNNFSVFTHACLDGSRKLVHFTLQTHDTECEGEEKSERKTVFVFIVFSSFSHFLTNDDDDFFLPSYLNVNSFLHKTSPPTPCSPLCSLLEKGIRSGGNKAFSGGMSGAEREQKKVCGVLFRFIPLGKCAHITMKMKFLCATTSFEIEGGIAHRLLVRYCFSLPLFLKRSDKGWESNILRACHTFMACPPTTRLVISRYQELNYGKRETSDRL